MRLLFVSQYIYRPDQPAANRIYDFLQRLAARGHDVVAVSGGVHYLEDRVDGELRRRKLVETRWGKVRVIQAYASADFRRNVRSRLRSYFSFAWYGLRGALRAGPVDAILVSIQPMFVAPLAWLVALFRGVPFIVEVRDLWPDVAVEIGLIKSRPLIACGRVLERLVYRVARHIVVIGPEMKRALVRKGVPEAKISVIPQGFRRPDGPLPDREGARAELGLADEFVVLFAGSFGLANNDVRAIVETARLLANEPGQLLLMVGEGNQKPFCEDFCRQHGLTNVRFLPMVPKNRIHGLHVAADVAVMALPDGELWKICLQNKIFDYMGHGLPVVAAVAGDQADLIERSEGGIVVPPGDVEGMARALLELKRDPQRRRRLGANAARHIERHLTRDVILDDYVQLIERLVPSV